MLRPEHALLNGQDSPVLRFGLRAPALGKQVQGHVLAAAQRVGMLQAQQAPVHGQDSPVLRLGRATQRLQPVAGQARLSSRQIQVLTHSMVNPQRQS